MRTARFIFCFLPALLGVGTMLCARPPQNFKVLLYTAPDKYHNQAIPVAVTQLQRLAEKHFFELKWTQLPGDLTLENLKQFGVVIFLSTNARELGSEQMEALKGYIHQGGGFVGIHAASVDSKQDIWFKKLIGRTFRGHPEKQTGILDVVDKNFPATLHLPPRWLWTDEWYEFGEALTENQHVLLTVDESTYAPLQTTGADGRTVQGMGGFHPIAWYQEYDGGRSFYTAIGHSGVSYDDPLFLMHLYGGIYWAATGQGIASTH